MEVPKSFVVRVLVIIIIFLSLHNIVSGEMAIPPVEPVLPKGLPLDGLSRTNATPPAAAAPARKRRSGNVALSVDVDMESPSRMTSMDFDARVPAPIRNPSLSINQKFVFINAVTIPIIIIIQYTLYIQSTRYKHMAVD